MRFMQKQNIFIIATLLVFFAGCKSSEKTAVTDPPLQIKTNDSLQGPSLEISFRKGPEHNHPLMAVWIEDTKGNFLQTLYVAESIGKGVFEHGDASSGKWMPGEIRRPAALPVWAHKRGIKAEDGLFIPSVNNPVADAITGATPRGDFNLFTKLPTETPDIINVFFEINQTWDFNEFWTNNKYPDNDEYKTSCQPALVYAAEIDLKEKGKEYDLQLVGHGHYAGEDGNLYTDVSTFTTALDITKQISVKIK